MAHNTPPSPALTKTESLPTGFDELVQHNATAAYHRDSLAAVDHMQGHSQPRSRYGTPQPHYPHIDRSMGYPQRASSEMPMYHQQAMYQRENSPYGPIPEPHQPYITPATSPPTPSQKSATRTTRAAARGEIGAKVLGPRGGGRVEKSTPKRKKERAKPPKNMPVLDKPLSEVSKHSAIPVADIEGYVHRSSEVRREEIETGKNPGRVKRPMNAFMLYRKAYQQRAKEWASQHNHQVVSRVCGMSWPLEPEHTRAQFKTWADIERDNHQKAHPNYKFTPSKPAKPVKFEGTGFDDASDGSDLEDFDWRAGSARIRSATHTPGADSDYAAHHAYAAAAHHQQQQQQQLANMHAMGMLHRHPHHHHSRSSSGGLDFAKPYDHLSGPYYDPHLRPTQQHQQRHHHLHPSVVDDIFRRSSPASPSSSHRSSSLPGVLALRAEPLSPKAELHHPPSTPHRASSRTKLIPPSCRKKMRPCSTSRGKQFCQQHAEQHL
ncbi:hypothetical protein N0V88_004466 [Collariella sp. IMI 366227]|nr:hypothetical protein N0V88_004466 [Collariella sp. IMI 366227]